MEQKLIKNYLKPNFVKTRLIPDFGQILTKINLGKKLIKNEF